MRSGLKYGCWVVLLVSLVGCNDQSVVPEDEPDASTWETISKRILEPNCTQACHTSGTSFAEQSGLVLTRDVAYEELVDVPPRNETARNDGLVLVSSAGPAGLVQSYLWEKIDAPNADHFYSDHPFYGALMPLGGSPLTYGELEYIRQWIHAGAPEEGEVADRALLEDTTRYAQDQFTPLAIPARGMQLRLGPFEVAPQFEREFFYYEPLTHSEDLLIERMEISMRPGSHHFILYTFDDSIPQSLMPVPQTIRDLREPNGQANPQNFTPMLYHVFFAGTQWPRMNYHFPPGVALRLPANTGIDLNSHYVNRGNTPAEGEVHINLHFADPAEVEHVADVLMMNNQSFALPPQQETTVERTFRVNERIHVFQLFSHAHEHMTRFEVEIDGGRRDGELVYVATDWEHPPILELDPPLTLESGEGFTLRATYDNDTDRTLRFGLLSEDEMMILFGYFYRD